MEDRTPWLRRSFRRAFPSPLIAVAVSGLLTVALASCGPPRHRPIEIRFDGRVGDRPARCGQPLAGVGHPATTVELADARLYVSNLELVRENGDGVAITLDQDSPWQHASVALLDFEDQSGRCSDAGTRELNSKVTGTVPAGSYEGLRFEVGLPQELNHLDATTAASPLNLNALYWNWRFGYIFMKVDFWIPGAQVPAVAPAAEADPAAPPPAGEEEEEVLSLEPRPNIAFLAHLGSTGCESPARTLAPTVPCSRTNRPRVHLPEFDPKSDVVVLDLGALVAGVDVTRSVPRPPGCMSGPDDPDCPPLFANLALDPSTGRCVDGCAGQRLARAERSRQAVNRPVP